MLHHHINKLDIERLADYSSVELEARLADIVHRITHLNHMLDEATEMAAAISDRISDHSLGSAQEQADHSPVGTIARPTIRSIGAEALALERFNDGPGAAQGQADRLPIGSTPRWGQGFYTARRRASRALEHFYDGL